MRIASLSDLTDTAEIAIIINVSTRYVSTLALLSTLRHARIPTVVVDCESTDGSYQWFNHLMNDHDFHLLSAPLRQHGETLDEIFKQTPSERVLLVDSDVEVLNDAMINRMRELLSPQDYGSGFLHSDHWLKYHYGTDWPISQGIAYYMSRPWIPFTLLRVSPIREALARGRSFMHRLVLNDLPQIPLVSRALWGRFRYEFFRQHQIPIPGFLRGDYEGEKPSYAFYDTGADVHEFLSTEKQLTFASVAAESVPWSVTHFSGITRGTLHENATADALKLSDTQPIIVERLRDVYGFEIESAESRTP